MAKGGSSKTVNATGPKSNELKALESQFYGMMNPLISGYTQSLSGVPGTQAANTSAPATVSAGKDGTNTATNAGTTAANAANSLVGNTANGVPQPYDNDTAMGQLFNDALTKHYAANTRYDDLAGVTSGYTSQINDALAKAGTEGDWWNEQAKGAYETAQGILPQMTNQLNYTSKANEWYDDYTRGMLTGSQNLLESGQVPRPILDAMEAAMTNSVNGSVGKNLADLASRGVLNSSVTNRGVADMSKAVANGMSENYLNALTTLVNGYNQSAGTGASAGKTFADTNLDIYNTQADAMKNAAALGSSLSNSGSSRVSELLGLAGGYGDALKLNLTERQQLMEQIPKYYTNAAAPVMPAYDFLQTMLQDHWNSNKQDTIVKSGK